LACISGKPEKYWKLRVLNDKVMSGQAQITRDKIREVLEKEKHALDILVCDPMKQHPIIGEILKDLEGNYSGLISHAKLQKTIEKMADLWEILHNKVAALANQVFVLASEDKEAPRFRSAVRKALEIKVSDIDKVFYPKEKVILMNLNHIEKVLQCLEESDEGEVTLKTFHWSLIEAAKLNHQAYDEEELKKLAEKVMGEHSKLSRDRLRKFMDVHDYEIADTTREPEVPYIPYISLNIANLSPATTDEDLLRHFTSKGYQIKDAAVMKDKAKEVENSKCIGYLNFKTQEEADRCLVEMQGTTIDKKSVKLGYNENETNDQEATVQAANLPLGYDQNRVRKIFEEFGNIKTCKLELNMDMTSKGLCFLQFKSKNNAKVAVDNLNLTHHGPLQQPIAATIYVYRKEQKKVVQNNFNNEKWGRRNWLTGTKAAVELVAGFTGQRKYLRGGKTEVAHGFKPTRKVMLADNSDAEDDDVDVYKVDPKVKEKSRIGKEVTDMGKEIQKFRNLLAQQVGNDFAQGNLKEARVILNKRIQQYEDACQKRLSDLAE